MEALGYAFRHLAVRLHFIPADAVSTEHFVLPFEHVDDFFQVSVRHVDRLADAHRLNNEIHGLVRPLQPGNPGFTLLFVLPDQPPLLPK